jgi:RsiW-degrading membrane proteinase PrsW (M82 family)
MATESPSPLSNQTSDVSDQQSAISDQPSVGGDQPSAAPALAPERTAKPSTPKASIVIVSADASVGGRPFAHLGLLALFVGLGVAALGLLGGGLYIALSLAGRRMADPLGVTTIGVSMAALGLGMGLALAWTGYAGLRGKVSRLFRPGGWWLAAGLIGWVLAVAVGQALISFDLLAPVTFPLFHVAGLALPALAILALTGRVAGGGAPANASMALTGRVTDRGASQRQVASQVVLGALGVTSVAFMLELAVILVGAVIVGLLLALTPGGPALLAELRAIVTNPARLRDMQMLSRWLLKPEILVPVIGLVVVVVPLIEEAAKSGGVPLLSLLLRRTPTPAQGWVWGVAVGTGFAISEGLFNGAASLAFWAGIALLRVGATAMHATNAGLTGLGWARTLASRRPWPVLAYYLASVSVHGLWNALTMLIAVASLWTVSRAGDPAAMMLGGLGMLAGLSGLALLTLGVLATVLLAPLRVK